MRSKLIKVQVLFACTFLLFACHHSPTTNIIPESQIQSKIQLGDLIVREGIGYESAIIQSLSQSHFSHIGMITQVYPHIVIIHATTDDKPNQPNQVIQSSFTEFTDKNLAKSWAIYRQTQLSDQDIQQMIKNLETQIGQPFVLAVKQEHGLYCSTLIANAYPKAIAEQLTWQTVDLPALQGELLFPNALIQTNQVIEIIHSP